MLQKPNTFKCLLLVLFTLTLISACQNFYKATARPKEAASIDSLTKLNRYFILRSGSQAYYMKNIVLSNDRKTLETVLDSLPPAHRLHLVNEYNGKMRYFKSRVFDVGVLSEVHMYIPQDNTAAIGARYTLPLDQVQKIEVIEKDKKRTMSSYVIGAIGATVGAFAVAAIIAVALKSSCPFVSAYDGEQFSLQGEIYGGAIYPQLTRYDFLPLKMAPLADGSLQLKISNELKERQYTDIAELLVVTHNKNIKVLADEKGNLYSVSGAQPIVSAWFNKKEVSSTLQRPGDNAILYMDDTTSADARNEVVMKFNKPGGSQKSKLVLTLKNSYWLDLLYGELAKGFGSYYATYIKQQRSKPAAELVKWISDQQIPLEVSIKTTQGWKKIMAVTTVGPLATRQMIIPIGIEDLSSSTIEIKLSSGFMFWEIDYAGMDFTEEEAFSVQKLSPVKATDEGGKDVLTFLQKDDNHSLAQPQIGKVATLVYKPNVLSGPNETQTYFLKTKGYYEHIREYKNKPDAAFLRQFTKPNALPIYGKSLYKKVAEQSLSSLASAGHMQ